MARRTVFWHIGTDDLGTAFLARALDVRREDLAAADVLVPGDPATWELATAELMGTRRQLGYLRDEVDGQAARLARRMWRHKGTSVLSTPGLAAASREQIELALDEIRDADLHLVIVDRDSRVQAYAAAQAALETGAATTRPEKFVARVLDPAGDHAQAVAYRAGHDVADIVARWGRTVLPDRVHLIRATEPELIWAQLTELLGVDVALPDGLGTAQLDTDRLAVLREVALTLDDQLDPRGRRTALRDRLARTLLAADEPATAEASLTTALSDAIVEVARLQHDNAELVAANLRLDRKRRKHKRRLRELSGDDAA